MSKIAFGPVSVDIDRTNMQKAHFIGIGGTAMAGAAIMARELGFSVTGSDQNVYSPTVDELKKAEIPFNTNYSAENLAFGPDLIILGNAISRGNAELEEALDRRMKLVSLPQFIADHVIVNRKSIVIAGTHGKTTSTSIAAHALRSTGINAGYMVGGVCESLATTAAVGSADCFVIEGDEYDTSIFDPRPKFLSYRPTHVLINNIEFDHADIFADIAAVELAFRRLVKIIPQNGVLVFNADNEICRRIAEGAHTQLVSFGESTAADYRLLGTELVADRMKLRYSHGRESYEITTNLLGQHNAMNIVAVAALLKCVNISDEQITKALTSFKGVRRRLQVRLHNPDVTVIEDFAHHPTAIAANLQTLRRVYSNRRLIVLIEPRSNTMVRKFFQESLAAALKQADVIFIDKIYRAEKYAEAERLNLALLKSDLETAGKQVHLFDTENRAQLLIENILPHDVVCFMTNGSFGGLIDEAVKLLSARTK